jgi:chorismate mutase
MDAITTEQMLKFINEIHEYLRSGDGDWSIDIDSPEVGIIKAIRAALDERDALKAEVGRLKQQGDVRFYDAEFGDPRLLKEDCLTPIAKLVLGLKARAENSEAELAAARPLLEAVMAFNGKVDEKTGIIHGGDVHALAYIALAYRAGRAK